MDQYSLWAATVRNKTLSERIAAAKAGGFNRMSLFPIDVKNWAEQGLTPQQVSQQARSNGVPITILDPFTQWVPRWTPPAGMTGSNLAFVDFDEATFLAMATALEVSKISVIESFNSPYTPGELVQAFGRICDIGREGGWGVQLEFMPFSRIADLATAWEIVRRADRDNGGLVFDTWHYFRGTPNHKLLRKIPGEKIFSVQLADARREIQGGSLFEDLMHYRLPPGNGDFDLPTVINILRTTGGLRDVGIELFSDVFDALEPQTVGQRAGQAVRQTVVKQPTQSSHP